MYRYPIHFSQYFIFSIQLGGNFRTKVHIHCVNIELIIIK